QIVIRKLFVSIYLADQHFWATPVIHVIERAETPGLAETRFRKVDGHRLESCTQPAVAAKIMLLPNPVRVEGRSLGSRMRLPDERSFAPDHVEKLGCVGGMVDGSVLRV